MTATCIYCLINAPYSSFNIEHVIPRAFGSFTNNFTLKNLVCSNCNQHFGDNLEIFLARDTLEGMLLYEHDLRKPYEHKSLGKRATLAIRAVEGQFKGAICFKTYSKALDRIILKVAPQIGFLTQLKEGYDYFLLDEIPEQHIIDKCGYQLSDPKGIFVLACELEVAKKILESKGIPFKPGEHIASSPDGRCEMEVEITGSIDSRISRAIAKIAFNYLAYWEGGDFVRHQDFNTIREYVLHGKTPNHPLVIPDQKPILSDEPVEGKRLLGHLVTVDWTDDRVSILSQVSLLNWMTYCVSLSVVFSGERRTLTRGHFFDPLTRNILAMVATRM